MTVNFAGHVYNDAGSAVNGASVKLLETGTTTQEGSTVTTDSNGAWAFTESDQDRYDVEITSGSSVRRIRWDDQISLKELDVRNNTGATTPAATFSNITNATANQVAVFSGANSTRADGDEIYLSFKLADSAGNLDEFARMTVEATDVTTTSEDGQIRFGVIVAGTLTDVFTINSTTGGAAEISYEVDSFTIKGGEGEAGVLYLFADQGDDAGDEWKVNVADGGVLTIGNDIASAGTYVTMMTITPHATTASSSVAIAGDATVGDDLSLTSDSSVFNMGAGNDFTITHDGTTGATLAGSPITVNSTGALTLDSSTDITLDADGADVFLKDGGTLFGTLTNSSGELVIKSSSSGTTAITMAGANVTIAGDLTISGDDLTMGTNTDTFILVADGTNYNPVIVSGDVTIANDGAVTIASTAVESGMLNNNVISGQTELASGGIVAADEIAISDGGTLKKIGVDNFIIDSPALVSEATIANGDYLLFLDGGATGSAKKEALADLVGIMAGTVTSTGLSDSSSVLSLDIQNMTASTTIADADLIVIDDGAGGTLRKMTRANFIESAALDAINIDGGAIDAVTLGTNSAVTQLVVDNIDVNGNTITSGSGVLALDGAAGSSIRLNEAQANVDVVIESASQDNFMHFDASENAIGVFSAADTDTKVYFNFPAITAPADTSYQKVHFRSAGAALTIPTGTAAEVGTMVIDEPNITATGTATTAFTLKVTSAPTEGGTNNYSLWVGGGTSQFDGPITVGVDDTGYDVKFFGDTSGAYMLWDTSADALLLSGALTLVGSQTISTSSGNLTLGAANIISLSASGGRIDFNTKLRMVGNTDLALGDSSDWVFSDVSGSNYFHMTTASDGDIFRVADGGVAITYNGTHPTGTFDYVCEDCGESRGIPFECHGKQAPWHDDVASLAPVLAWADGRADKEAMQHLSDIGVMDIGTHEDGSPWVGINLSTAQWFTWSAMNQMYKKNQELEARLVALGG